MNLTTKFLFFYFLIYICDCCVDDQFNTLYTFDCNKQYKKILSCSSQCVIKNRNTNVNQSSFTFLKDINSIDVLKVEKCVMNFLPNGFNKSLSMINSLEIIRTQLKEITKENLKQFPKLKKLSVPFNDLTKINDDLLDFNSKIDYIDIRYNKILNFETPKEIAEVLRRANRLIHFSKEGNFVKNDMKLNCKIINERFDEKLKDYDTKWQSKKHKKNLIGKFHDIERKMENFIMSKSADVSSSSESSEQRNENLKIIRTQLKGITNENLRQFPELQMLVVQYNDLTSIDDNLFEFNKKIKIVNLMHNKLINFNTEKFNEKAKTNINFNTKGNCLENDLKSICQLINERINGELQNYDTKWQTKRHEKNLIDKIHELEQKLQNQASFKSSDASSISESSEQRNENLKVIQFDSNIFIIIGTFINSILIIIIFFLIWKFNLKIKNTSNHHQPVIVETVYSQPKNALPDNDEYIYPTCGSMPRCKKISKYDKKNENDSIYEEIDKDEEFKYIKGVN
ncbi:hypothetical protein PVAND_015467 [Polypedilum vanderplanki]|uniref:L domain-like protein n=1 Tax=Polypedilum vanderplanki TaxID=319348 RepID=A0A9J6BCX2_POLVA|nr:hypothetical protein PVAND_015467 [Polypedilum vanderplanki]